MEYSGCLQVLASASTPLPGSEKPHLHSPFLPDFACFCHVLRHPSAFSVLTMHAHRHFEGVSVYALIGSVSK